MLKRTLRAISLAFVVLIGALGLGLAWVHVDIRSVDPPLPSPAAVLTPPGAHSASGPLRIRPIITASQPMSRGLVLDSSLDPTPDAAYSMAHTSFVLEWADGRIFLIDTGMPPDAAMAFGKPAELVGAGVSETHGGVTQQLGLHNISRVSGIAFTHLHQDHTSGLENLCSKLKRLDVFQAPLQFERGNYTTGTSEEQIANAACATPRRLEGGPLFPVPGFPGLFVIQAAGHTPGSQLFVAHLPSECDDCGPQIWLITGDVVNNIDGVRKNIPKPPLYSALLVPESPKRLDRVRRFLQTLENDHGVRLLVSHDQLQIESSGLQKW